MHPLKFIWRVFFLIAHPNFTYPTSCPPTASLLIFNVSGSSSRIRLQDSTVCQHHRGTPMSSFYPLSCNEDLSTKMSFSYQILKKGIFNQNQLHRHLQVPSRKTIIFSQGGCHEHNRKRALGWEPGDLSFEYRPAANQLCHLGWASHLTSLVSCAKRELE